MVSGRKRQPPTLIVVDAQNCVLRKYVGRLCVGMWCWELGHTPSTADIEFIRKTSL
jgi:hypothetical protein